jgi:hypothetical protein
MKHWLILFFFVAAFSKIVCGDPSIQDLSNLDQLKQVFEKDSGKLRIIALLSPT